MSQIVKCSVKHITEQKETDKISIIDRIPIKQNANFVNKIETEKPRNIKVSPFCFELTYQIHVLKYPQSTAGGQN